MIKLNQQSVSDRTFEDIGEMKDSTAIAGALESKTPPHSVDSSVMPVVKVAYVLTSIDFGGSDRVSVNFLQHVDRQRFEIVPILLTRPWEADNIFAQEVHRQRFRIERVPVAVRPPSEGRDRLRVVRCVRMMRALLQRHSFDLIHTHGYFADIVALPVAKALSIPSLSTCHGFIDNNLKLRLYNSLDRLTLRFADRIIAVSDDIKRRLVDANVVSERIEVIPNAVATPPGDPEAAGHRTARRRWLKIADDERVVAYVGRLSPEKGVRTLIRAAALLVRTGVRVKILLVGDGPEQADLAALVEQEGLTERVVFAGFQNNPETWMPAFDVFCLPSFTEGTPMSLLEAMAHGIPVVASAVGGIPRVIESGGNGILVPPDQPEALCEAIAQILENDALRTGLAQAARRTVAEHYNIDDWTRRIEELYERLARTAPLR